MYPKYTPTGKPRGRRNAAGTYLLGVPGDGDGDACQHRYIEIRDLNNQTASFTCTRCNDTIANEH
jgi:hypothetical protein